MPDDRDGRRNRDPLHAVKVESLSDSRDDETPVEALSRLIVKGLQETAVSVSGEIDTDLADRVDSAVVAGMQRELAAMRPALAACEEERIHRHRWRIWRRVGQGITAAGIVAALGLAVRMLLAAGAASETSHTQHDLVRDTAARVRVLETQQSADAAVLSILQARAVGRHQPTE